MILSLQSRISDLITAIGTDIKQHRTWITGSASGDLTGLTTTDKTSVVAAVNELQAEIGAGGSQPDASETVKGIAELATLAEVATGTDALRIVTAAGVRQERTAIEAAIPAAVPAASTTVQGKIEIATLAEMTTGTDSVRAATPEGVKQETAAVATPAASETVSGKLELATLAEAATGTDTLRAMTPQAVRQERTALKAEILGAGVPAALDTLDELAAALADDANYAATITTALGNKQPLDADLTAIAALTSAADKVPYATGAGAWALTTVTAAARGLLDDADVATMRGTLAVYSTTELGNPETDLAALYVTAKA